MGKFSNHCNNRFRGAFKHAVNQSIKEYNKNKQESVNKENKSDSNDTNSFLLKAVSIILLLLGNLFLITLDYFDVGFISIIFLIFIVIIDSFLCYHFAKKTSSKIKNEKFSRIAKVVLTIVYLCLFAVFVLSFYLGNCHSCHKIVFEDTYICQECRYN